MQQAIPASGRHRPTRTHDPTENYLLAALPLETYRRILPELELVRLRLGQVLAETSDCIGNAYFPTDSIVSLLYVTDDGGSAETAVIGREGLIGISLFMGGGSSLGRAVVQSAGYAYRIKSAAFRREFHRAGALQHLTLRFTQALITQTGQTAVCNTRHSVDQQLSRWLLLSFDRLRTTELNMTQELIANMLGVRREGVTVAAHALKTAGLIEYSRGRIRIIDRSNLELSACECYRVVKREYDRLIPASDSANW